MSDKAEELENERYDPVLDSWVDMQKNIHDLILEAFINDETSALGNPKKS